MTDKTKITPVPPPFPGLKGHWYLIEGVGVWGVMTSEQAKGIGKK